VTAGPLRLVEAASGRRPGAASVVLTVAVLATALVALAGRDLAHVATEQPLPLLVFVAVTLLFQFAAVPVYGRGSISVAGIALLATGFAFGVGGVAVACVAAAVFQAVRKRSPLQRGVFNAATWILAAGLGAAAFRALEGSSDTSARALVAAVVGAAVFCVVNIGLLTLVMSVDEFRSPYEVWSENFRWLTLHYVAFGPLALALDIAHGRLGFVGVTAFLLPPVLLSFGNRQYLDRTRAAAEELRRANDELHRSHLASQEALVRSQQAEEALRDSESRFRQLAGAIPEVFFLVSASPRETLYVSPAYEKVWGRPVSDALGAAEAWQVGIHPDDRLRVEKELAGATAGTVESSFRVMRPDGEVRWVVQSLFPVRDEDGVAIRIAGVARDLTEQRALEEQLRQSQKMEAVGQLAGGIAHDFNNLLTVISGYAEMSLARGGDPKLTRELGEIVGAADRAAGLTKQILAFSRRQVMQPKIVGLNDVILGADVLVRRLLGDAVGVRLELDGCLDPVLADAGQLGQVVMNLSINARDAMPGGGMLTIRTENVELGPVEASTLWGAVAGRYVKLSILDTGVGMDRETQRRIFEPFFTTKEPGKGTGLGLSTCYGIVKQSGGYIGVESDLGVGTTFAIYLPAAQMPAEAPDARGDDAADAVFETAPRVLLVEDDDIVRGLVGDMLELHGFDVTAVGSPRAAIETWGGDGPFDVLVTDLAMPSMTGRELVQRLADRGPLGAVVFISGFSSDALANELGDYGRLVLKPFTAAELVGAVQDALTARHAAA